MQRMRRQQRRLLRQRQLRRQTKSWQHLPQMAHCQSVQQRYRQLPRLPMLVGLASHRQLELQRMMMTLRQCHLQQRRCFVRLTAQLRCQPSGHLSQMTLQRQLHLAVSPSAQKASHQQLHQLLLQQQAG